jgi:hypothetical protein
MHRKWQWIAAGFVVLVAAGAVTLVTTDQGQRAVRYTQRRFGWGEEGRQAREEALWQRALANFRPLVNRDQKVRLGEASYDGKPDLLALKAEALARTKEALQDLDYDYRHNAFWLDLLIALDRDGARQWLKQSLQETAGQWIYKAGFMDAVDTVFTPAEIRAMLPTMPAVVQGSLLRLVATDVDQAFLESFLLAQPDGTIPYDLLQLSDGWDAAMAVYPRLGRKDRIYLLRQMTWRDRATKPDWPRYLVGESDPAVRQAIYELMQDGPAFLASLEQDGAFPEVQPPWEWEKRLAEQNPDSFYARGIRAYEAVRGRPYFEIDRRADPGMRSYREFGNHSYDCDREIPGWTSFLATYGRHESADDAAYRLGRCYESRGQYAEALRWLLRVPALGDADMTDDARPRVVWILDAELDEAALRALPADLPDELPPMIAYTIVVKELRAGRYAEAHRDLDAFTTRYESLQLPMATWFADMNSFWAGVRQQQAAVSRLEGLAAGGAWADRYNLAAAMYHDELLFYNYLWGGGRHWYLMDALLALQGDADPAYTRWVSEMNNLLQAVQAFEQVRGAPAPYAEKAEFSRAMALAQLAGYGRDVAIWRPISEVRTMGPEALQAFLHNFPHSSLVPDALLSLGFITGDASYLDRIVKEYPKSSAAATARGGLPEQHGAASRNWLPFRYLWAEEAPPDVAARARALAGMNAFDSVTAGDYTYLVIGSPRADQDVVVTVWDTEDGQVNAEAWPLSGRPGPGYAIARIAATSRPVSIQLRP